MKQYISREYYMQIFGAANTLCGYCKNGICDKCIVNRLVSAAYNECPEVNEEYSDVENDPDAGESLNSIRVKRLQAEGLL